MKKKLFNIAIVVLFSLGLTVLANTIFEIDEAFFTETGISSGDYSPLHFNYSGNNADGIMFFGNNIVQTGEITMSGFTIDCDKQIKGLYINTTRGDKIWPLDQETLASLSGAATLSGYDTMELNGGFFTECTGNAGDLGYTINSGEIYGYIEHTYSGESYELWAGVDYNFSSGVAINTFSGTLLLMTGANITSKGFLFDNYGGIANVYSNQDMMGYLSFTGSEVTTSGSDYYTIYTGIQLNISSNQDSTFELSGDLVAMLTGDLIGGMAIDQTIELIDGNGSKNIQLTVSNASGTNVSNLTVILNIDLIAPILSFTDAVATGPVQSDIIDIDRDDATVTKWMYTGGTCSSNSGDYSNTNTGRTINTENNNGQYVCLYAEDNVGNISTGMSLNDVNIDITDPTFAGVTSGAAYSGNRTITFDDTNLSGATLNGDSYTGGTEITGDNDYVFIVSDLAGNSTGATFSIDKTAPVIYWIDVVELGPVASDTISVNFADASYSGYKLAATLGDCSSTGLTDYTGAITYDDETTNGKYFCAYAKDSLGNRIMLYSENTLNIDITDPTVGGIVEGGSYTGSVVITYSDTNLSGDATLDDVDFASGATVSTTGSHIFIVSDLAGNSVTISFTVTANSILDTENPTVSLTSPTNWSTVTGSSSTFSWTGFDNVEVASYSLYINGPTTYTNMNATSPIYTPLATGDYTRYVIATDTSDNTGQSTIYNLTMTNAANIDTTKPVVELLYPTNGLIITGNSINLQWSGSDNVAIDSYDVYINGSTNYSILDIVATSQVLNPIINGSYTWYVIATDVSGNTGHSDTYPLVISGSIVVPTLISPISGANIYIGDLDLIWSGTSSSGFEWQIANDTSFANIVSSGESDNLTVSVLNNPDFMTGLFYWRVISNNNIGVSDYWSVNIVDMTGGVDIDVDDFDFDNENDANLSEVYESNEITIEGISDNVYVNAILEDDIGALFINDIMVGSQGLVKNGDKIYIELISSNEYDTKVSAYLIVGTGDNEVSDTFKLYTKEESDTELSYGQKLQAALLLDSVVDTYGDNSERLAQFLITFKSILEDKSDWLEDEINDLNSGDDELEIFVSQKASVDYMYDIVDDYLDDMDYEGHNTYTAPNGKVYIAEYRNDKLAYTSPDFMYDKFFPTRDQFTAHIDINNRGNYYGGGEGEKITAPNDKIYYIYQKNGKWTSNSFWYEKYFDTREQIIDYISANNPIDTWDHELDTDFDLLDFQAPNGNRYTIFKTSDEGNNPDMYSSYKFVTPKYFPTLQRVKDHIVSNNQ